MNTKIQKDTHNGNFKTRACWKYLGLGLKEISFVLHENLINTLHTLSLDIKILLKMIEKGM
jgi:hypothetical protein